MKKFILASKSPRRKEMLKNIGLDLQVIPSNYEEDMSLDMKPEELCMFLAEGKADEVASRTKDSIIISADTFVVQNNKIIGKPKDKQNAIDILKSLSGTWHEVYSGICIIDSGSGKKEKFSVISKIKFREISEEEIINYVNTGEPMDKAGAYGLSGLGGVFVEKIEGSCSNIRGMPIAETWQKLKQFDIMMPI